MKAFARTKIRDHKGNEAGFVLVLSRHAGRLTPLESKYAWVQEYGPSYMAVYTPQPCDELEEVQGFAEWVEELVNV